ncbi:MAG: iron-containing alcohol dehydrogenase [Candidatus Kapaibacterium sp.]
MALDPSSLRANWNYPTSIRFGIGRISELADACAALGMRRPLLVTDPGLAALPMVRDAIAANATAGLPTGIFSDIRANPIGKNVENGVAAYRAGNHDGVIAFGGGSGLDAGKAIAFMAGQDRPIWDFEDIGDNYKRAKLEGIAPVVAVPTTAGTGSEVGRASVITDEDAHIKKIIFHPRMLPGIAIADPELTIGLPNWITAATGMDALAHNLEAYCGAGFHPMAEGIALEGIRIIKEWLPVAVRDGSNLMARTQMMAAASMGAAAFQKALGAIHALSHPLGAVYDLHHGLLNAVVMPYVMAFNRSAIEGKMTRLAGYLELEDRSYQGVFDWIIALRKEIGIPHTLADVGVDARHIDRLAAMAAIDPSAAGNPIPIGVEELKGMFIDAIEGKV